MTGVLAIIFVVLFVGGPLVFRMLTRGAPTPRRMRLLAVLSAGFVGAGLIVRFALPDHWGQNLWLTAVGLLFIWFAWIGVLAFVTQALRQNDPSTRMRRWTAILGALGTTVPWFGLVAASMVQG